MATTVLPTAFIALEDKMPQKGDIAFCAHNFLGLITSDQTTTEPATAGNIGAEIWTGIQLTNKNGRVVGGPWQSRNPRVVAHSDTLLDVFEKAAMYDDLCDEPRPKVVKKGGAFDIESLKRQGVLLNPPEPGNLFPPQPYEPVRYAADGLFEGDSDYNGD